VGCSNFNDGPQGTGQYFVVVEIAGDSSSLTDSYATGLDDCSNLRTYQQEFTGGGRQRGGHASAYQLHIYKYTNGAQQARNKSSVKSL